MQRVDEVRLPLPIATSPSSQPSPAEIAAPILPPSTGLPSEWVERIFDRMTAAFGNRFATMWASADPATVKREWAEALAGFSGTEILVGLNSARSRDWPPTLGEFMRLCRPEPPYEDLFIAAQLGHRNDPVSYWAAQAFGGYELRIATWPKARARWIECVDQVLKAHTLPPIPDQDRLALPAPGQTRTSAVAREAIDSLKRMIATAKTVGKGE